MKLIVGLGNPGSRYEDTRHNVGFVAIEQLAKKFAAESPRQKFKSEIQEVVIGGEKSLLMRPQTFMNLSGESVQPARDFYKIELADLLVICDDFAIPLGTLRMRASGTAGGQNGLNDIIRRLGTNAVPRLRIGIGPLPPGWDAAGFVLGKFDLGESMHLAAVYARVVESVELWVREGIVKAMNRANTVAAN